MIQEAWVVVPILLLFWALVSLYKTSVTAAAAAKSLQSCLTLSDPIDGSPPGSPSLLLSLPIPSLMPVAHTLVSRRQEC